jgi:hypothetical protein
LEYQAGYTNNKRIEKLEEDLKRQKKRGMNTSGEPYKRGKNREKVKSKKE